MLTLGTRSFNTGRAAGSSPPFELRERLAGAKIYRTDTNKAVGVLLDHVVNRGIGLVRLEALEGTPPPALAVGVPSGGGGADADTPTLKYHVHAARPAWWPAPTTASGFRSTSNAAAPGDA